MQAVTQSMPRQDKPKQIKYAIRSCKTMPEKMIYKLNEATIATRADCAADRMLVTLVTAAGAHCITINGNLRFRLNHFHLSFFFI
jgi:hypothetical protein